MVFCGGCYPGYHCSNSHLSFHIYERFANKAMNILTQWSKCRTQDTLGENTDDIIVFRVCDDKHWSINKTSFKSTLHRKAQNWSQSHSYKCISDTNYFSIPILLSMREIFNRCKGIIWLLFNSCCRHSFGWDLRSLSAILRLLKNPYIVV